MRDSVYRDGDSIIAAPQDTAQSDRDRFDRRSIGLIGLCALAWLLDGMIPALLGPLAPSIAKSLSLSKAELGPVFSANLVGQSLGLTLVPLASRWVSSRTIICLSMIGFGIFNALSALTTGSEALIAFRLVTGFFVGGALPLALALVAGGVPPSRRGTAIMLLTAGFGLGGALAGVIVAFFGSDAWREIFVSTGLFTIAAAILVGKYLKAPEPERQPPSARRINGRGPLARILSPPLVGGTILFWLMFICALTINYCLSSWLPTLLVGSGRGPQVGAFAFSIFAVGGIVSNLCFGPVVDRFGGIRTVAISFACGSVCLLLAGSGLNSLSSPALLALLGVAGFFILGSYGGINVVLADYYPAELRAVGAGWGKAIGRVGTTVAPIAIGLALDAGVSSPFIMSLFAIPAAVCVGSLIIVRRIQTRLAGPVYLV